MGRQGIKYTEEEKEILFQNVLNHIKEGMAFRNAIKQNDTFSRTIWDELIKIPEKNAQYAHACKERADAIFEDIIEIADNSGNDVKTINGVDFVNHEAIQRDKLRVDARKWAVSKMDPKKYGDKLDLGSSDGSMSPNKLPTEFEDLPEELLDKMANYFQGIDSIEK